MTCNSIESCCRKITRDERGQLAVVRTDLRWRVTIFHSTPRKKRNTRQRSLSPKSIIITQRRYNIGLIRLADSWKLIAVFYPTIFQNSYQLLAISDQPIN